jgi:predicted nucleotidyltransferase
MAGHVAHARRIAADVAADLVAAGARAVVLVGSVARGDAHPTSDIDLIAVGTGPADRLLIRSGRQVSVSWRTAERIRESFTRPWDVGARSRPGATEPS